MAKINTIICTAVVILCYTSAVFCQVATDNESNVQGNSCEKKLRIKLIFFLSKARTFGHHFLKRISFAIIPAAFVVGMIFTLLAALTVVSVKSLGVGVR